MRRPDWIEYFMTKALIAASRSVCLNHLVGCVIVDKENQTACAGYNGPLPGDPHCSEVGCNKVDRGGQCVGLHAEKNAINSYPGERERFRGGKVFITEEPCFDCTKELVKLGIAEVWFLRPYTRVTEEGARIPNQDSRIFAEQHGLKWNRYVGDFVNPTDVLNTIWQRDMFPYQGQKGEE